MTLRDRLTLVEYAGRNPMARTTPLREAFTHAARCARSTRLQQPKHDQRCEAEQDKRGYGLAQAAKQFFEFTGLLHRLSPVGAAIFLGSYRKLLLIF